MKGLSLKEILTDTIRKRIYSLDEAEKLIRAWAVSKLPTRKEGIVAFLDKEGKQYYSQDQLADGAWNQCYDLVKKALEGEK